MNTWLLAFVAFFGSVSATSVASSNLVTRNTHLQVHAYHAAPLPVTYQNSTDLAFSPTVFTLISGRKEAILVDAPINADTAEQLSDWISKVAPGRKLTGIYVTHGHGDHFFASATLRARFPEARVIVLPDVYAHMRQQVTPEFFGSFWGPLFPGLVAPPIPTGNQVQILPRGGSFFLEGHELRAVEVGESDTYNSTVLFIPELKTVVTGDVIYGHCHQLISENTTPELRAQWVKSIDKVAALHPRIVVPSHALPTDGYGVEHIRQTRAYILAFEKLLPRANSWAELETGLKKAFPDRTGSFILRFTAQAFFNAAT